MHDLIRDMGHEIVRRQSKNKLGKYSRLWSTEDVCNVLQRNCVSATYNGICFIKTSTKIFSKHTYTYVKNLFIFTHICYISMDRHTRMRAHAHLDIYV